MPASRNGDGYTPTQQRMLALLSDGLPHTREELFGCLWDRDSQLSNIKTHISHIRSKLRLKGQDIVCELVNRSISYRHIRLLTSIND